MAKPIQDPSDIFTAIGGLIGFAFLGFAIFVTIATQINPHFFSGDREKSEQVTKKATLSDSLELTSYKLTQHSYCNSEYNDCDLTGYDKRYSRTVEGSLLNKGDTIKAWTLHIFFDIYEKDGDIVDGAYCIVWNDEDIPSGSTWDFEAFDNIDDCFAGIDSDEYFGTKFPGEKQIDLNDFDIRYRSYDTNYNPDK